MTNPAYVLESIIPRDLIKYELTKYNISDKQERINECRQSYYERVICNSDNILYHIQNEYERQTLDDYIELDQTYSIMLKFKKKNIEYQENKINIDKAIVLSVQTLKSIHEGCYWWDYSWDVQFETMILGGIEINDIKWQLDIMARRNDPNDIMNQIWVYGN
tara:strand:+ start:271 stop:756 length:486 start_codon:yes stop_codon:yes gene_type:complete